MESWLITNEYAIPEGASDAFDPYIQDGSYLFVAKVKADDVTFRDEEMVVPYWMTNSPGHFGDKDVVQWGCGCKILIIFNFYLSTQGVAHALRPASSATYGTPIRKRPLRNTATRRSNEDNRRASVERRR